ncbi:cyclic nucleotide-binding domain-containing protein [Rhodobacteraceae bacterium nBUS_24]|mgnify:CR=1|jgi:CRP/FNR family transcriptional activator FtrB|nr:cyclic nucleotide-binding domain-containing protein [Marinovum sp.]MBT6098755.1 cyclic nucleotide-binding domain-containing protein [Marinovum sp.]MBT6506639.1 cyclic nucleotide-binding domain-containing protein [Marinovum sp.]MBT6531528.1 cyclic nucleotide-binding domain-containing protein [Marinovum sp.]MBT7907321.1 cyclic nucleotide-binding domain-containing protein [Marinovum sp.]
MPELDAPNIRQLELFKEMDGTHFDALMRASYVQNFPPQLELISEGDPSDFLHVVVSGCVELFSSWNGRESTLAVIRPVSTFILAASIRNGPYLMSARTLEKSRIILIPSQDVRAVFDKDPKFARAIVEELAQVCRNATKHTKDLKLRTALERLANYLLTQQKQAGNGSNFSIPIEKRHLASLLGMTPENLSRALKKLRAYGVLVDGQIIAISKQEELERLAKPNRLIDDASL